METSTENQEIEKPVIVDPEEFGLTIKKGSEIEGTFSPLKTEYDALLKVYELIVNSEITSEVCERAKRCRIDAGKQIKKVSDVHKVEKAVFWNGGLFVDAIKNRDTLLLELIKTGAKKIEDHYLRIELERIEKVRIKRTKELKKYTDQIPDDIGPMRMEIYDNFLAGAKVNYEAKIEAEKKKKEEGIAAEKAVALHNERKEMILPYWAFVPLDKQNMDFSTLEEGEWKERLNYSVEQKEKHDAEQGRIKKENERLKKEADEKDRLANIESDKRAEIEAGRIYKEEEEQKKRDEIESVRIAKEVKKELERKRLEHERQQEQQAILYKEREAREKVERQLKIQKEAEEKKQREDQEKIQVDLNKDDAAKKEDLVNSLEVLMVKYTFKSKKSQTMWLRVTQDLSKIIKYVEE